MPSKNVVVAGFDNPNLTAPQFPDALNGRDGKINRLLYNASKGLRFLMQTWAAPDDDDYVVIEWSPVGVNTWTLLDTLHFPVQITTPTVERVIPETILNHGRYEFRYKVKNGTGGPFTDFSFASLADIDLYAPFKRPGSSVKPPIVKFPAFLATSADIITQALINAHAVFPFEVLPYTDWEDCDRVRYWFTQDNPADNGPPSNTLPIPAGGLRIDLPTTFFADPLVLDGIWFFVYMLIDAAGNESELSRTQGRILKRGSGLVLGPLIVRERIPNGLIDIPELVAGVRVAIPQYAFQSGDHANIKWGSQSHGPIPLNGVFDFEVPYPTQLIIDDFGASTLPVRTATTYTILRSGSSDSPPTPTHIFVNLWVPGPPPPKPGEVNPTLPRVHLEGPASQPTRDYLAKADFDHAGPIVAHIILWLTPSPRMNDIIKVYWGSLSLQVGKHTLGSEAPGAPIAIDLDKTALASLGNGFKDLFYTVNEPGSLNTNLSVPTPVEVDITAPVSFPRPDAPDAVNGWFNCQSNPKIWNGVRISVNKHTAIRPGDEIRLKWIGTTGFAGGGVVIPETVGEFKEYWSVGDDQTGSHIFVIPYYPNTQPLKNSAGGSAEFSVWRGNVLIGSSIQPRYLKFDRVFASNPIVYCGPNGNGPEK
ncbi:hypothetical protein HF257_26575 [Pseudomonas sp. WS 5106]|uniref:Uncharacterized protein n=1 Tax=Pseudomonas cremoris TaxID=2724178 RepID=A0A7X1ARU8_9PSED|nr:hypothetical protein [Pseudomonas cremoris]MBC2383224.1 hypothetical protein [Pseudomonas cremoris]MBC2409586.1 hypothetical protein [Pseudomonas cremoris]